MMLPPQTSSDNRSENVDFILLKARRPTIGATHTVIPAILIILVSSLSGCASLSNPKPADEEIKKAIMVRGASNPLFGRIELESVQVEQIGNYNAEKKYWPVKARVTTKQTHQSAVLEYQIFRDDFGKWTARQANRS
jgi:hypothetical protein